VKIGGIILPFLVNTSYKIPVAGYFLRFATATIRLPIIIRDILEFEAFTNARFTESNRHFNRYSSHMENEVSRLSDGLAHKADIPIVAGIQKDLLNKAQALEGISTFLRTKADLDLVNEMGERLKTKADLDLVNEMGERLKTKADLDLVNGMGERLKTKADVETVSEVVGGLRKEMGAELETLLKEIGNQKLSILDQQRRFQALLQEAREKLAEGYSPEQIQNMVREENHLLDTLYFIFENEFRGSREEVKEKQKIFLRYVEEVDAGRDESPVIDIGCGRGEWLELLKENGYVARGVDNNRTMVRQCKDLKLDVIESEAIKYLRTQEPNTFGMITGFHIVEHLSFEALIALFDESFRALKSGGVVIFEAPNPENLIVGCCNFYFDPTHRNPIPPKLLDFLLRARGFSKTEIVKHHPYNFFQGEPEGSDAVKRLMAFFNAEQDYAVIGYKE
jgi:SAM-dependent methyltransferase